MTKAVVKVENDTLSFSLDMSVGGKPSVFDKRVTKMWDGDPEKGASFIVTYWDDRDKVEGKVIAGQEGEVNFARKENRVIVSYSLENLDLEFQVIYVINGNILDVEIPVSSVKETGKRFSLMNIEFLPRFGHIPPGDGRYIFYPLNCGVLCECTEQKQGEVWAPVYADGLTMPVFGVIDNNAAFLGIIMSGEYDSELGLICNPHPEYLPIKICAIYPKMHYRYYPGEDFDQVDRKVRYIFLSGIDATYVGMAKAYRDYLLNTRGLKTLREKMKDRPILQYTTRALNLWIHFSAKDFTMTGNGDGKLRVHTTFSEAKDILDTLKVAGIERVDVTIKGWACDGHDGKYPTKFPIESRIGGEDELKDLIKYAHKLGYLITFHDNYQDGYQISPEWDPSDYVKNPDGSIKTGGLWSGGRAFILCPKVALEKYAKRDLPRVAELGAKGTAYLDVLTITPLYRCYDPKHPLTKRECAEYRCKILLLARDFFGAVQSEGAMDWANGVVDKAWHLSIRETGHWFESKIVPFYQIAYHGIVQYHVILRYPITFTWKDFLKSVETGALPLFLTSKTGRWYYYDIGDLKKALPPIKEMYTTICEEIGHLQLEFIENHRELKNGVFETVYSDGTRVITNYTDEAFITEDGYLVKPRYFTIIHGIKNRVKR